MRKAEEDVEGPVEKVVNSGESSEIKSKPIAGDLDEGPDEERSSIPVVG